MFERSPQRAHAVAALVQAGGREEGRVQPFRVELGPVAQRVHVEREVVDHPLSVTFILCKS